MDKPNSPSCERNKEAILEILKKTNGERACSVLEIGSGTGQHGVYFSKQMPQLKWTMSDKIDLHQGIRLWMNEANLPNIEGPYPFEIGKDPFPKGNFDLVFTANTMHIMSWKLNKTMMKLLGLNLKQNSLFMVYGPFNYRETYTSDSNRQFDQWLKERDPKSGIRSFEDITICLSKNGFSLLHDFEMPAHNRLLVFHKD